MNAANIPNDVFTWVSTLAFSELTTEQRETVLACMSEEDYSAMYHAASVLDQAHSEHAPKGKSAIKEELLKEFDSLHPAKSTGKLWLNYSFSLGKVAALVLLFLSTLLFQYFRQAQETIVYRDVIQVDTVYKELASVPVEKVITHDTVWQPVYITKKAKPTSPKTVTQVQLGPADLNMHIEGIENFESPINRTKNNSYENDSLVGKIGFVTL